MTQSPRLQGCVVNIEELPQQYPTNHLTAEFWEHLGRTVATYGFLEEVLGKAIFALTATRTYTSNEAADQAFQEWLPKLERALSDPLGSLIVTYGKAIREHQSASFEGLDDLITMLKTASQIRNILCHGSWRKPDENGASVPLFVNRNKQISETSINIDFLRQNQRAVAEMACIVISTVTHIGIQFPGSGSPGEVVLA